ncbi:MAG: adenylate/guanylate cyclase domain-containing protein, partial [Candidatus Rifleibacteriota bacterium]
MKSKPLKKHLDVYVWFLLISMVSLTVFNWGNYEKSERTDRNHKIIRNENARQILSTLAHGAKPENFLASLSGNLKKRLEKESIDLAKLAGKEIFIGSFPEHEFWLFELKQKNGKNTADPVAFPKNSPTSRKAMANSFLAMSEKDYSNTQNKVIDFLFGPGLKVKHLAQRKSLGTRVIYRRKYYQMVWDVVSTKGKETGGYILLVPDNNEFARFAMTRTSLALSGPSRVARGKKEGQRCLAGYLNLFSPDIDSIFPPELEFSPELKDYLKELQKKRSIGDLEKMKFSQAVEIGKWELYAQAIPDSTHLAIAYLDKEQKNNGDYTWLDLLNFLFLFSSIIVFFCHVFNFELPSPDLKTRFSMLFFALAAIPFSILLVAFDLYQEELRTTMLRDSRQKLETALSLFDRNVEEVNLKFQGDLRQIHLEEWLQNSLKQQISMPSGLDDNFIRQFSGFSPPLPWAAIILCDAEGRTFLRYRSDEKEKSLEGYMKFNRVGIIEAMRNRRQMPGIEVAGANELISETDITVKMTYENQVKLPVYHPFSNFNVGNTAQVSFADISVMRYVDYYPSEQSPVFGMSVIWSESELNREFCLSAVKKVTREFPSIRVEVFQKQEQALKRIVKTHQDSDLVKIVTASNRRNGFAFSDRKTGIMELAFPSTRRPEIFLAGSIDISHIQKKLNEISRTFFWLLILGMASIFFFRNALFNRMILPLLLLEKTLMLTGKGQFRKLPEISRKDEFKLIFTSFNEMIDSLRIRDRLLSLVSGSALEAVKSRVESAETNLPEKKQFMVALVSDIRNFTTHCEQNLPEEMTSLLNLHFDRMTSIIHAHDGEIGRFVGDAIEAQFFCAGEAGQRTLEKAVKAALMMLEAVKIINEERVRKNLFPYKIGIGLAYGPVKSVKIGEDCARAEVMQLGKALKIAAGIEPLSKSFPDCPIIIDEIAGSLLMKTPSFKQLLQPGTNGEQLFFHFARKPIIDDSQQIFSNFKEKINESPVDLNRSEVFAYNKNFQEVSQQKTSLNTGMLLLIAPFLIILFAVLANYDRSIGQLENQAHLKNQNTLTAARLSNAKQQILEKQFSSFITSINNEISKALENHEQEFANGVFARIKKELASYNLNLKKVFIRDLNGRTIEDPFYKDPGFAFLPSLLGEGIRCYDGSFNRYLLPDQKTLAGLNNSISPLNFAREVRHSFTNVSIGSESFWLYWQPILKPFDSWGSLWANPKSWQMRIYGRFAPDEISTCLQGGLLILCDAPKTVEDLNDKGIIESSGYVRIDVKNEKIIESAGSAKSHEKLPGNYEKDRCKKFLELSAKEKDGISKLVIDKNLISSKNPELQIAFTSIKREEKKEKIILLVVTFLIFLIMMVICLNWFLIGQERGLAMKVITQIFGCFLAALLLPVSGVLVIIMMLHGDWQNNLIEQSKVAFGDEIGRIEQRMSFHLSGARILFKNRLAKTNFSRFAVPASAIKSIEDFEYLNIELKGYLKEIFEEIFLKRRAFGFNSFLVIFTNGLNELMIHSGELAESNDPMKRTFSFHAARLTDRIDAESEKKRFLKKDARQKTLDEIIANDVFSLLDSTYGDNAGREIMFGQGKVVKLFGGFSADVIIQEFYPGVENPLALLVYSISGFHANQFSLSRILMNQFLENRNRKSPGLEIFAVNRNYPGMPPFPEYGEKFPFLRQVAMQTSISGPVEKTIHFQGEDFQVVTQISKKYPQFVFAGIGRQKNFQTEIRKRVGAILTLLLLAF